MTLKIPGLVLACIACVTQLPAQTLSSMTGAPPGRDTAAHRDSVVVRAFASGALRAVATGGTSETNSADGSVGINLAWPRYSVNAVIGVSSSAKPLTRGFGASLLNPASGTGLKSGLLDVLFRDRLNTFVGPLGLHLYVSASSRLWSGSTDTTEGKDATVIGLGALLSRQIAVSSGDNRVALGIDLGLSLRKISGDISDHDSLRTALLGSPREWFCGIEAGMATSVNKITAAIQLYYYWPRHVQGVGHWQMTTGVSVEAELFSFRSLPENR